jgi:hypothetical protein
VNAGALITSDAYVLFYERQKLPAPLHSLPRFDHNLPRKKKVKGKKKAENEDVEEEETKKEQDEKKERDVMEMKNEVVEE